jgi:hypothetical protein
VALRTRLKEMAAARVRYGNVLLRREGWAVNHRRVYRLYSESISWKERIGIFLLALINR